MTNPLCYDIIQLSKTRRILPSSMINYAKYGIFGKEYISKLDKKYGDNPQKFYKDIKSNPYQVMIDIADIPFRYADENIIKYKLAKDDCYERCQYATYTALKQNESNGSTRIKDAELAVMVNNLAHNAIGHIATIVNEDKKIYYDAKSHWVSFVWTYNAEKNIAENIKWRIENKPNPLKVDIEKHRKDGDIELTDEQLSMLDMVSKNRICMLNGAAGCGKSQTLNAVLNMLDKCHKSYACMASTGIASKVMKSYTHRPASTIHMFLLNPHSPDYIIVDEISTVSVHLLSMLFSAVNKTTNFIFIGDSAQLPSISCGSIVRDITTYSDFPRVNLTKIFRYNSSGIVTIATDSRHGVCDNFLSQYDDYSFIPTGSAPINQVVGVYDELLNQGYTMDDIMVLCPFNVRIGCDEINRQISEKYNANPPVRKNSSIKIGDKVINTKNTYGEGQMIANGDIGWLRDKKGNKYLVEFDFGERWVDSLTKLKQAYSVSIHKSQGSSSKVIVLLIDKSHIFMLNRNLLYTAITRAKEKLIIIGDIDSIKEGLKITAEDNRNTWIGEMLND